MGKPSTHAYAQRLPCAHSRVLMQVADLRCAVQYVRETMHKTPVALIGARARVCVCVCACA